MGPSARSSLLPTLRFMRDQPATAKRRAETRTKAPGPRGTRCQAVWCACRGTSGLCPNRFPPPPSTRQLISWREQLVSLWPNWTNRPHQNCPSLSSKFRVKVCSYKDIRDGERKRKKEFPLIFTQKYQRKSKNTGLTKMCNSEYYCVYINIFSDVFSSGMAILQERTVKLNN